jgi:hypothetical protein
MFRFPGENCPRTVPELRFTVPEYPRFIIPACPNPRRLDTISLRRLYVLLFTRTATRRVHFAGCTANPDDCWSRNEARQQRGRSLSARNQFVYWSAITIAN